MTQSNHLAAVGNGRSIDRTAIPELPGPEFREAILEAVAGGQRVVSLFGAAEGDNLVRIYLVLGDDQESRERTGDDRRAVRAGR